jgi:peroxiredoxin
MMELEALEDVIPQITALGATLVAVSPQREIFLRQMKRAHGLTFTLLRDAGNTLAKEFRLLYILPIYLRDVYKALGTDLARFNGDDSWSLPLPARYIIDQNGMIKAHDVNPDYTRRPEPEQTLSKLRALSRA